MYDRSETPDPALRRRERASGAKKLLSNRASVWMICGPGEESGR
jgi:hypothetical protein